MSDGGEAVAWVGRAPCGCALFASVDEEPGTAAARDMNRDIADLRRKGWTIERRTVQWVRDGGLNFNCPHRKKRKATVTGAGVLFSFVLFLCAPAARADVFDAAAIAGSVGDIVTTELALKRGFVEQNIQQRGPRIGANLLITGACLVSGRELERQGHRGWAKAVKLVPAVVFGGFAIKNWQTMRRVR